MLATSNATVNVGTTITLTSTVASTNGPTPTGTVQFKEGATVLGSGALTTSVATGGALLTTASLTLNTLAPGTHTITAVYTGDANDATSTSAGVVETVAQINTTVLVSVDANPANAGGTLHITATITIDPAAVPDGAVTGQVTFTDGVNALGAGTVANGVATLSIITLSVGTHNIVATYAGNTNYAASTIASAERNDKADRGRIPCWA